MLQVPPPAPPQALQVLTEMPLLPGSDPMLLGAFQWAFKHSPSLSQLVQRLVLAERKARYRFVPGLDSNFGRLVVEPTRDGYDIDIEVPIIAWNRCGDALEPWIASSLLLAFETASKGRLLETRDPKHFQFLRETMEAAFAFQAKVRKELVAADPERLKDLPDGQRLYESGYRPSPFVNGSPRRRALPDGLK